MGEEGTGLKMEGGRGGAEIREREGTGWAEERAGALYNGKGKERVVAPAEGRKRRRGGKPLPGEGDDEECEKGSGRPGVRKGQREGQSMGEGGMRERNVEK